MVSFSRDGFVADEQQHYLIDKGHTHIPCTGPLASAPGLIDGDEKRRILTNLTARFDAMPQLLSCILNTVYHMAIGVTPVPKAAGIRVADAR